MSNNYKESSIDIIEKVVLAMTFPVKILKVDSVGDVHTLTVCDIFHAQPDFKVDIAGNEYTIQSTSGTTTMIVKGTPDPVVGTFQLYKPNFFHGTPTQQGVELIEELKATEKTPMIWLYEQFTDKFFNDPESKTERDIIMRLFFLTDTETDQNLTEDAYQKAIEPMRRLAENFERQLNVPQNGVKRFNTDTLEFDLINYHKFGVFINNKGMEKSLWQEKLAGCEMAVTLPVFRVEPCEDDQCS